MTKKNLCINCEIKGLCCYHSVIVVGKNGQRYNVILKSKPCQFLDLKTKKCLVYKNRYKVNPYCITIKEAIRQNALPVDCLYVKDNEEYKKNVPKIDYIPDDLPKHVLLKLQAMEQMSPEEFRRMFLPLIL